MSGAPTPDMRGARLASCEPGSCSSVEVRTSGQDPLREGEGGPWTTLESYWRQFMPKADNIGLSPVSAFEVNVMRT